MAASAAQLLVGAKVVRQVLRADRLDLGLGSVLPSLALLIGVSERLVAGGEREASRASDPLERMRALVVFHVDFALGNAAVIRVQDRDLAHLSPEAQAEVRRLQRAYIELWMEALSGIRADDRDELRLRVQACFEKIDAKS